jgi:hypothetical protein
MNPYLQFGCLQINDRIRRISDNKEFILTRIEPTLIEPTLIEPTSIEIRPTKEKKVNIEMVYHFESEDKLEVFHGTKGKPGFIKCFNFYLAQYHSGGIS